MFLPLMRPHTAILLLLLILPTGAHAQTSDTEVFSPWTKPAHQIVEQVLEVAGAPASVSIEVENRSGLTPAGMQQIRLALDHEFRSAKVKVVRMDSAVAEIKFTLSRNVRGLLWIAQVKQGTSEDVTIMEFPDPMADGAGVRAAFFRLQRTLLLARSAPMLDVAVGDDFLLVLGGEEITRYPQAKVNAAAAGSIPIAHANPWPRDLRGRLFLRGGGFTAYLPGIRCSGTVRPSLTGQCFASDDPWPLLGTTAGEGAPAAFFASARNHFSGVLTGSVAASSVVPFFSAARLGDGGSALWAFSGTDGFTRLYIRMDGNSPPLRTVTSLGSDLAAVKSECGAGWQLLVTGDGDENSADVLQAFEMRNREATAVSDKLNFDGPIKALWPAEPGAVTVIVRDPGKESYEAYSISVNCGR